MIEPAKLDGVPTIAWNGKKWPIPELAARQLDLVWDDVIALSEALRIEKEDELGRKLYSLTGEQMKRLRGVVYVGLTRAHPELAREDFDDVPATPAELVVAYFVVRTQSLIFGRREPPPKGEVDPPVKPGDGTGEGASPTSNGSSPAPAATSGATATIGGTS